MKQNTQLKQTRSVSIVVQDGLHTWLTYLPVVFRKFLLDMVQ